MKLRLGVLSVLGALCLALPVGAQSDLRPKANPARGGEAAALAAPSQAAGLRPKSRPAVPEAAVSEAPAPREPAAQMATSSHLRPKERPAGLLKASSSRPSTASAIEAAPAIRAQPASSKGSVCGVAAIKGKPIAPIKSRVNGCGLEDGVQVTSVSGVRLSMPATIDCTTAKALNKWVESALQPAYGGKVVELKIAGHYVCRPRNHKKGAKVSEHGRGRAVDISGLVLSSGKTLRVLGGFDKTMRRAHKGACGIFGTTLGPGSDGYHEDHLHFDTARHSNGAYCR